MRILEKLLNRYEHEDFVLQRKAQVLAFLCIILLVALPMVALYTAVVSGSPSLNIQGPVLAGILPASLSLWFLVRGRFAAAGHLILFTATAAIWVPLFLDRHSAVVRLDSMVYVFALLAVAPLVVLNRRRALVAFFALNFCIFGAYAVTQLPLMAVSDMERSDFVLDTLVGMGLTCSLLFLIFEINRAALARAEQDIAEREHAEEHLRKLQSYLRNVVDSMPSFLIGLSGSGSITQWNVEAARSTGISESDALNRPLAEVIPELSGHVPSVEEAVATRTPQRDERVSLSIGGRTRVHDLTLYPLVSNGAEGAVLRIDDVTEKLRIEQMMIQSEKMLSVGGLAAGMAHEINNPLAGILQNLQLLRNRLGGELPANQREAERLGVSMETIGEYCEAREIGRMLDAIESSGKRAARIVESMLSFSRKSTEDFRPQDLTKLLDETCVLASSEYDMSRKFDFKKIRIVREYADELPLVECDGNKIQQVLFNLISNAAFALSEASDDGTPTLTLRAERVGRQVRLEIEDNGPGMPEETLRRVFEPFFTTKEVGVGTGLGLSVAYFIVTENHGGSLEVESTPGSGARFILTLPVSHSVTPPTAPPA